MPKRKRHQPGKYKPKPEIGPNFIGNIEIAPEYRRIEQTEDQKLRNEVYLASKDTVLSVTPDNWGIVAWFSSDFFEGNE